jgi:formamidopyrimidine-DNA glycosylase
MLEKMPELPEVQIVVNGLNDFVSGRIIRDAKVLWSPYLEGIPWRLIRSQIPGEQFGKVTRLGKYIFIRIGDLILQVHLRMTGALQLVPKGSRKRKHTHFQLIFSDNNRLDFSDTRKFGRIFWLKASHFNDHVAKLRLGVDPVLERLTGESLMKITRGRKKNIKNILLDQNLIAGIGNIYASEILFKTGLHPLRPGSEIKAGEAELLAINILQILETAVKKGGSTINDYLQVSGESGEMQNHFQVYGREGSECYKCGARIKREIIAGRSSFYCPECQRGEQ